MTALSGRELDRAIAQAKGWRNIHLRHVEVVGWGPDIPGQPTTLLANVPHYSTDWREAGPLLEEMRGRPGFELQSDDLQYWMRLYPGEWMQADELPTLIARAWYAMWQASTLLSVEPGK